MKKPQPASGPTEGDGGEDADRSLLSKHGVDFLQVKTTPRGRTSWVVRSNVPTSG